ncbi:hypothetical protein D9M71_426740 [compost metagenome]
MHLDISVYALRYFDKVSIRAPYSSEYTKCRTSTERMKLSMAETASLLRRNPTVASTSMPNSRASYSFSPDRVANACSHARPMASSAAGVLDWARRPKTLMRVSESTSSVPQASELDHLRLNQLRCHIGLGPLDSEIVVAGISYQPDQCQSLKRIPCCLSCSARLHE